MDLSSILLAHSIRRKIVESDTSGGGGLELVVEEFLIIVKYDSLVHFYMQYVFLTISTMFFPHLEGHPTYVDHEILIRVLVFVIFEVLCLK